MNDWLSLEALSRLLTNGLYVRNLHQHKIEQINFDVVLACPHTFILPFFTNVRVRQSERARASVKRDDLYRENRGSVSRLTLFCHWYITSTLYLQELESFYSAFQKYANSEVQKPPSYSLPSIILWSQATNLETQKHTKGIKLHQSQITNDDLFNSLKKPSIS